MKKIRGLCWYGAALWWALWALLLPLYSPLHYVLLVATDCAVFFLLRRLSPPEKPPEPIRSTGNETADALIRKGLSHAETIRSHVPAFSEASRGVLNELAAVAEEICRHLISDPADAPLVRRFYNLFTPETEKLLLAYSQAAAARDPGENQKRILSAVDGALPGILSAYKNQLNRLYEHEATDVETDLAVMEQLLRNAGLFDGAPLGGREEKEKSKNDI